MAVRLLDRVGRRWYRGLGRPDEAVSTAGAGSPPLGLGALAAVRRELLGRPGGLREERRTLLAVGLPVLTALLGTGRSAHQPHTATE